jgi:DNA-binding response OmpR family regulator
MSLPLAPRVDHPFALIVDRDPDTRHLYAEYLRQSAYEIEEAEDGREALAKAIMRPPDVIVTETRLPGIDGYSLCRLLREDAATHHVTIVVVTGDAFAADTNRAMAAGADVVLVKPCLPENLVATIRRLLTRADAPRGGMDAARKRSDTPRDRASELSKQGRGAPPARLMLSRSHRRHDTTEPPVSPPTLVCPMCEQPLQYVKSHIGGVSVRHQEQWDYFECAGGCGTFQYRQRTRKLRRVI